MSKIGWSHLNSRFGNLASETSRPNIEVAVREMFHEDHPDLLEGDYAEHSAMWIDYGFDAGPVYTLYIRRRGLVVLEKRLDQDDLDPAESYELQNTTEPECVALGLELVAADINSVMSRPWNRDALQ